MKIGILVSISILLLLTVSVYAENNTSDIVREDFIHELSNDTNDTNVSTNNSTAIDTTETVISGNDADIGNVTEDLPADDTPVPTDKESPGFESIIAVIVLLSVVFVKKTGNQ